MAWPCLGSCINFINLGFIIEYYYQDNYKKMENTILKASNFNAYFGENQVVKKVNIENKPAAMAFASRLYNIRRQRVSGGKHNKKDQVVSANGLY